MGTEQGKGAFAAVIAAAGLSSRMGNFKPLLPFGESTILGTVIDAFRTAGAGEIIVVCGHRGEELAEYVRARGVSPVQNPDYAESGMFESLCCGLAALQSAPERIFLTPGDVPRISAPLILRMLQSSAHWAVPLCGKKHGHPVLLTAEAAAAAAAYRGSDGLRGALHALGAGEEIPWEDASILLDADTAEEYQNLLEINRASSDR